MVLRLLVPGGSGDWSLCTGRKRSQRPGHNAGSEERPRQEDGASGGGTSAAAGTSSPYLAHHGAAEQPAAPDQCYCECGSGHGAQRGESGNLSEVLPIRGGRGGGGGGGNLIQTVRGLILVTDGLDKILI